MFQYNMVTSSKVIRIRYSTWNKLKRIIPPRRFETLIDYIDRVLKFTIGVYQIK